MFHACIAAAVAVVPIAIASPPESDWIVLKSKAGRTAIAPDTGERRTLPPEISQGVVSPDGRRIAFLGTPPGGDSIDLFVADLVPAQNGPPAKANAASLVKDVASARDLAWTPDAAHLVFLGDPSITSQVYWVAVADAGNPDARPRQISDASGRCAHLDVLVDGRIAWAVHREQRGKEPIYDLVIADPRQPAPPAQHLKQQLAPEPPAKTPPNAPRQTGPTPPTPPPPPPPPPAGAHPDAPTFHTKAVVQPMHTSTLLKNVNLWSFKFSPDASTLAYAAGTSVFFRTLATGDTREIPFTDLHKDLYAHGMHHMAWRRDGKLLAGTVTFLGGRASALLEGAGEPPAMFGDKEIFFFPVDGKPWWHKSSMSPDELRWIAEEEIQASKEAS